MLQREYSEPLKLAGRRSASSARVWGDVATPAITGRKKNAAFTFDISMTARLQVSAAIVDNPSNPAGLKNVPYEVY
jgi:hypothetical protein